MKEQLQQISQFVSRIVSSNQSVLGGLSKTPPVVVLVVPSGGGVPVASWPESSDDSASLVSFHRVLDSIMGDEKVVAYTADENGVQPLQVEMPNKSATAKPKTQPPKPFLDPTTIYLA